jgi:hypothetical protein
LLVLQASVLELELRKEVMPEAAALIIWGSFRSVKVTAATPHPYHCSSELLIQSARAFYLLLLLLLLLLQALCA